MVPPFAIPRPEYSSPPGRHRTMRPARGGAAPIPPCPCPAATPSTPSAPTPPDPSRPHLTPRQMTPTGFATLPGRWICEIAPRTWRSREIRRFLDENLVGEFAELGGRGRLGRRDLRLRRRCRWEKVLAEAKWTCLGWPVEYGGRGASITEQVIFNEEYARAAAPGRVPSSARACLARRSSITARPSKRNGSSRPSVRAPSSGARATRSPTPAATWPTSRQGRP